MLEEEIKDNEARPPSYYNLQGDPTAPWNLKIFKSDVAPQCMALVASVEASKNFTSRYALTKQLKRPR